MTLSSPSPLQLLLVDDDDLDRMAVHRAVRASGMNIDVAQVPDAPAALRHLEARPTDCLLLDLRLPGMSGLDLLRELRAGRSDVPVIVLTSQIDEETDVELMRAGANGCVSKGGLSPGRLAQTVDHVVRVRRAERESRRARDTVARYVAQLRLLADAASALHSSRSVAAIARTVADRACEIIGARSAVLRTVPLGDPPQTHTAFSGEAPPASPREPEGEDDVPGRPRTEECLEAPLHGPQAEPLGMLRLWGKLEGEFAEPDEALLAQLAQIASIAISNALRFEAEDAARRARDDTMVALSHDLRGPLSTITMGAALLLADRGRPELDPKKIVLRIERSAKRMEALLSELVDLTRIDACLLAVQRAPTQVDALVRDAVAAFRSLATSKGLALSVRVPAELPLVLADRPRIVQVLGNLIDHALSLAPAEGRVTVGAELHGATVRLFVSGTGAALAPELLPRIFDRRRSKERGAPGAGTGNALFIAKGIVDAHGEKIWAENQGESGSTFVFTLAVATKGEG